jgi:hypothetical protein
MSAAHLRSGRSAAKSRASVLGATGLAWAESVVRGTNVRLARARMPSSLITFATVFSQAAGASPRAARARHTRGLP